MVCFFSEDVKGLQFPKFALVDNAGETDSKQEPELPPKDLNNEEEEEDIDNQTAECQPDMPRLPVSVKKASRGAKYCGCS